MPITPCIHGFFDVATVADHRMLHRRLGRHLFLTPSMNTMQSLLNDGAAMASMTIRDLDDRLKARLRMQAARHGRSMEEEAREILRTALAGQTPRRGSLVDAIRARMEPLGGVDLTIAPREPMREVPDLKP
jgi:plasmid stability protein